MSPNSRIHGATVSVRVQEQRWFILVGDIGCFVDPCTQFEYELLGHQGTRVGTSDNSDTTRVEGVRVIIIRHDGLTFEGRAIILFTKPEAE